MSWLYVPGMGDSPSESSLPVRTLTRSATWRGKLGPLRIWFARWKRGGWLRLLSGVTLTRLTADAGVDTWISSQLASRASRSARLATSGEPRMSGGSGRASLESLAKWNPDTSSWRTCQALFAMDCPPSWEHWPTSGSLRNGICSRRPRLAHLTADAAGSSLLATPTVVGNQLAPSMAKHPGCRALLATPTARDWRSGQASAETHDRNARPLSEQVGGLLNPRFVEAMMLLPIGWTGSGPSGMEWSRWWSLMRGELSRLGSVHDPAPAANMAQDTGAGAGEGDVPSEAPESL